MSAEVVDRRAVRRRQTIEEALDIALQVIAEEGVAGLSAGEVARRMGIKPPSLYVYFPSKHALYDALFERGARGFRDALTEVDAETGDLRTALLSAAEAAASWAVQNPSYSQLLFWRPVPGFEPSAAAYGPAQEAIARGITQFRRLQERGLLRDDVTADVVVRDWTILLSGVMTQQLANEPGVSLQRGTFTARLPTLVEMFASHYEKQPIRKSRSTRGRDVHA